MCFYILSSLPVSTLYPGGETNFRRLQPQASVVAIDTLLQVELSTLHFRMTCESTCGLGDMSRG